MRGAGTQRIRAAVVCPVDGLLPRTSPLLVQLLILWLWNARFATYVIHKSHSFCDTIAFFKEPFGGRQNRCFINYNSKNGNINVRRILLSRKSSFTKRLLVTSQYINVKSVRVRLFDFIISEALTKWNDVCALISK